MGRGPGTDPDIRDAIAHLAARGYRSADIRRELEKIDAFRDRVPPQRTVDHLARASRPNTPPPADLWRVTDADPDEVGAVLDALVETINESEGRRYAFSKEQAQLVVKIQRAVPDMPPAVVWQFADEYAAEPVAERGHLDVGLGLARALNADLAHDRPLIAAHVALHVARWMRKPLVVWARYKEAAEAYIEEVGNHASLYRSGEHSWFDRNFFGRLIIETETQKEAQNG